LSKSILIPKSLSSFPITDVRFTCPEVESIFSLHKFYSKSWFQVNLPQIDNKILRFQNLHSIQKKKKKKKKKKVCFFWKIFDNFARTTNPMFIWWKQFCISLLEGRAIIEKLVDFLNFKLWTKTFVNFPPHKSYSNSLILCKIVILILC